MLSACRRKETQMPQKQTSGPQKKHGETEESAGQPSARTTASTTDEGIDAMLDEIDEVLEGHTEEEAALFVQSYVQKGGQ
jgi:ubiquitin-like protein Pup